MEHWLAPVDGEHVYIGVSETVYLSPYVREVVVEMGLPVFPVLLILLVSNSSRTRRLYLTVLTFK